MRFPVMFFLILIGFMMNGVLTPLYAVEEHFGIHANKGSFQIHAPNNSDSDEVKAYVNAFPDSPQTIDGLGGFVDVEINIFGIDAIGLGVTRYIGTVTIQKTADPENTPEDSTDDIFIKKVKRDGTSTVLFLEAVKLVTIGVGYEDGSMRFDIDKASGESAQRNFNFSYPYLHGSISTVGLTGGEGPYLTFVFHSVTAFQGGLRGSFSGTTYALALGWVF